MEYSSNDDFQDMSLTKFESMLKTNDVLFFDSSEFENIIHHYLENGKIALAKKAIKLGLQQHPTSINLSLFKIEIYILENKFDDANTLLDDLHNLEPNNEEIYIQKANVLSKQDMHQEAINALLIALDLSQAPDDDGDLYGLIGMEYLFLDQFENALIYFKKCLDVNLTDYSALHNVMYCFDFLDQNQEAIDFLNVYLDKNPYCEVAWHQLGRQYFAIKQYEKANASFDFAIISDDTFIGAYIEKGKVLEKLKKYTEAIENYKITLALDDPTSFALLRIGHCYEKLGEDDLAVQFFDRTVKEDPLLDKGWIAITKFYIKHQNYQKALYFINKAVNIDNDNVLYWKLYAQINQRLNFLEEAERGYKHALDLGNYELDTWLSRTDILINLGEYEASIFNLLQSLEFYPESAEIEYRLGGLYFKLLQTDKGHYHLKNGLRINADYDFIIEELFPCLLNKPMVKNIISTSKKSSN
ncbi:tetratricopeptide repeat protein [Winogradskyella immobilis]|uniref:Tetratricopeptide repeat protein n=1 Tax=Winogradskyella immobilis TaxID=2816852 RepID=A0ABS8EPT2_9FLAO|nr:tetratricopeptide repeat protein [Winogradskyella immobilis]MCC1485238.1 tetratricopeptide repeat protein [Winogradskyella immobilis]MCG0017330.1 tetratricopeptide repeat protein [Winogradskyella immobilis]